jgi:hypothetical protein
LARWGWAYQVGGVSEALPRALSAQQEPRPFTEAELLNLGDAPPEGLVAYDPPSLIDTGVAKKDRYGLVARYMLAQVGNRRVFALVPAKHSGKRLIGWLHIMNPNDRSHSDGLRQVDYEARDQVMKKFSDRPLAPYYFEVTRGRGAAWAPVAISGALGLAGAWFLLGGLFGAWGVFAGLFARQSVKPQVV